MGSPILPTSPLMVWSVKNGVDYVVNVVVGEFLDFADNNDEEESEGDDVFHN